MNQQLPADVYGIPLDLKSDYKPASDDWKGERLISAIDPEHVERRIVRQICSHKGCDKVLGYSNVKGLCMAHRTPPTCGAYRCKAKLDFRNTTGYCRKHVNWKKNNRAS